MKARGKKRPSLFVSYMNFKLPFVVSTTEFGLWEIYILSFIAIHFTLIYDY